MKQFNSFLCQAGIMLLLFGCQTKNSDNQALPIAADYLQTQFASFSDDSTIFLKAFARAEKNFNFKASSNHKPVQAGIVAHHLYIADLIAEYFLEISATTNPKKIILMGPNHRARGKIPIATSLLSWKTPFGTVETHRSTIKSLISSNVAKINDDAFFMEHSIGALVPFIKRVFPGAAIVPLVLLSNTPASDCDKLSNWLAKNIDNETLLLASIDFSHYKTAIEAAHEDGITIPIIQQLRFERANDAYVCSRTTLRVLLRTLQSIDQSKGEIVHHTNSGILSGLLDEPCTSYINVIWRRSSNDYSKKWTKNQERVTFLFGGDILIHPSIARRAFSKNNKEYCFDDLFAPISPLLKRADIAVANLEGTFAGKDIGLSFFPTHNYPDELAVALSNAGITTISLANNHAADTGCSGLKRTRDVLLANGIKPIGLQARKALPLDKFKNVTYSILAYTYGTNYGELSDDCIIRLAIIDSKIIERDIFRSRKAGAQIIIVFLHCGTEYKTEIESWLKRLAYQIARMGADAIICAHPHVVRSWEWIQISSRRVFVHYSLGNLISSHSNPLYNKGELVYLFFKKTMGEYNLVDIDVIETNL